MTKVKESEMGDPEWWLNHHKQSVRYLVIRIHQLIHSTGRKKQSIENILIATLPAFAESVEVDLNEVKVP